MDWHLFVDESGDFDVLDDDVLVAGILVADDRARVMGGLIKAALLGSGRDFSWPLHAWVWRRPAMMAVAAWLEMERRASRLTDAPGLEPLLRALERLDRNTDPDAADLQAVARRLRRSGLPGAARDFLLRHRETMGAWLRRADVASFRKWIDAVLADEDPQAAGVHQVLAQREPAALEAVVDRMRQGKDPRFDGAEKLERAAWDAGCRRAYRDLGHRVRELRVTFIRQLECLAGSAESPESWVVLAGETRCGSFEPPSSPDRYRSVLASLLERTASLVEKWPGEHHIWLHVATRPAHAGALDRRIDLRPQDVAAVIGSVLPERTSGRVRLVVAETPAYRGDVDPLLVLADFVANASRTTLGFSDRLRVVESKVQDLTGLRPRSGAPISRSHVTAAGPAWAYLMDHLAAKDGQGRLWAWEQADEWRFDQP